MWSAYLDTFLATWEWMWQGFPWQMWKCINLFLCKLVYFPGSALNNYLCRSFMGRKVAGDTYAENNFLRHHNNAFNKLIVTHRCFWIPLSWLSHEEGMTMSTTTIRLKADEGIKSYFILEAAGKHFFFTQRVLIRKERRKGEKVSKSTFPLLCFHSPSSFRLDSSIVMVRLQTLNWSIYTLPHHNSI